ncbi:MAG: maleylpyruvate isomerase family mycothiol-dependent enzyme [Acidimicrobiia bacterium]
MPEVDFNAWIAHESNAFASTLDTGRLARRVPSCPDWTLRDVAWHLGIVQRFWSTVVRAGADVEPAFQTGTGPTVAGEVADWMRASTAELLDALGAASSGTPAWTWWRDDRTVGAIARHQVHEAAVHRWDAQSACGLAEEIPQLVADDGVDEFVGIARQLRDPAPIVLIATDTSRLFRLSDDEPVVSVSATASELVLVLYGRTAPDHVAVDGDRTTLDAFLRPIG